MKPIYPQIFSFHFIKTFKSPAVTKKAPTLFSYRFENSPCFLKVLYMASSSKSTKSPRITPYNLPPMKVRNQEECRTFVENHRDLLGQCRVWWESGHDIHTTLPAPSDPQRPCTEIYPWFLDLGLRFPLSDFLKSILPFVMTLSSTIFL